MTTQNAVEPINLTVREFCQAYKISRVTLYDQWKKGTGPESFTVGSRRLIPIEAARSWRPDQGAQS